MRILIHLFATIASIVTLAVAVPSAQKGYDLFQRALVKERAEGKASEAIQMYRQAIAEAGTDKVLIANALLQIAGCYEKLGSPESQKTYEQLLNQYGDQPGPVAIAKAALAKAAGAGPTPSGSFGASLVRSDPIGRRVDLPNFDSVSPDGRYYLGSTSADDLEVRSIATRESTQLTHAGTGEGVCDWAWSRDSERVFYAWCSQSGDKSYYELRVVSRDGTGTRVTLPKTEGAFDLVVWSQDERMAALSIGREPERTNQLVSLVDGTRRDLRLTGSLGGGRFAMSPDAQYLTRVPRDTGGPAGIWSFDITTSQDRLLFENSFDIRPLGWTPTGQGLLYLSDRLGTWDIWLAPIANGRLDGPPVVIKRDVGPVQSKGITNAGAFFYNLNAARGSGFSQADVAVADVFLVRLDPTTGKVASSPTLIHHEGGHSAFPVWSRSGRELAFKTGPSGISSVWPAISILSMDTGRVRTVRPVVNLGLPFDWSPDGQSFLQFGSLDSTDPDRRSRGRLLQLYRVDVANGTQTLLTAREQGNATSLPKWFPDGKAVAFRVNRTQQVVLRDLETGQEKTIVDPAGAFLVDYEFSPDGSEVAFLAARDQAGTHADVRVTTLADGRTRTLIEHQDRPITGGRCNGEAADCGDLAWSSDGRYLVYSDRTADTLVPGTTQKQSELWRIPVSGGRPEKLGLTLDNFGPLALSPDGRHLAFMQVRDFKGFSTWVIDNLLPASELVTAGGVGGR